MPAERTEAEMLAHAPIKAQFGGKPYEIQVLTILKARKWREKMFESAKEAIGSLATPAADMETVFSGLSTALFQFPEKVAELIFAYDPALPSDEILEIATEEDLSVAFSQIMKVAFPFGPMLKAMGTVMQMASSASAKYTN